MVAKEGHKTQWSFVFSLHQEVTIDAAAQLEGDMRQRQEIILNHCILYLCKTSEDEKLFPYLGQ